MFFFMLIRTPFILCLAVIMQYAVLIQGAGCAQETERQESLEMVVFGKNRHVGVGAVFLMTLSDRQ